MSPLERHPAACNGRPGICERLQPSQPPTADFDAARQLRIEAFGESGNASKNPKHGGSRHMRLTAMGGASTMM
ncbi:hypothetical protein [Bosea vestrisii]|uniref:Uncharacterized protein n=1 Tax=Bosea vestrisii TaxID=151416 RepID=A0ABW0H2S6_9HYPH